MKNEGWRTIIVSISKSLENESDQVVACGFRCLKLVVSNYINRLSQHNFVTVLNAIHMYASNAGTNINNNLIAIGMFQNVADYTAKQIMQQQAAQQNQSLSDVLSQGSLAQQSKDRSQVNFEQVWDILFERIHSLGSNKRAEVRKTAVHTLENIVMTHGGAFQLATAWPRVLSATILSMLKYGVEKFTQSSQGHSRDSNLSHGRKADGMVAPTPTFFG